VRGGSPSAGHPASPQPLAAAPWIKYGTKTAALLSAKIYGSGLELSNMMIDIPFKDASRK